MLTIVMYHYVRDLARSRFPEIKGLNLEKFDGQLEFIDKHYTVVGLADVLASGRGTSRLPSNACVLSFDDGFIDHYTYVFPRLSKRGWTGSLFPPPKAILENTLLDVHKIHTVLASLSDPRQVVNRIFALLIPWRSDFDIPSDEELYAKIAKPSRYDPPEIVFIKKSLQRELPEAVRSAIVDTLFADLIADEKAFAREFYMDVEQMQMMIRGGMEFGGHGYQHVWLNALTDEQQQLEIDRTVEFLACLYGRRPTDWAISYPYGAYNETTLRLVREAGCEIGLTTEVAVVHDLSKLLELARLNTNDLPCTATAEPPPLLALNPSAKT